MGCHPRQVYDLAGILSIFDIHGSGHLTLTVETHLFPVQIDLLLRCPLFDQVLCIASQQ